MVQSMPSIDPPPGVALAAAFILVWVNGAVGVIGTERDDANLILGQVPLLRKASQFAHAAHPSFKLS